MSSASSPRCVCLSVLKAHRIEQIAQNAVEEKVLDRAAQKLRLDQLVIQQGRADSKSKGVFMPLACSVAQLLTTAQPPRRMTWST